MAFSEADVRRSHKVLGDSSRSQLALTQQTTPPGGDHPATYPVSKPSSDAANRSSTPTSPVRHSNSYRHRHRHRHCIREDEQETTLVSRDSFDSITDDPFFRQYNLPERTEEHRRPSDSKRLVPRDDISPADTKPSARYQESLVYSEAYDLVWIVGCGRQPNRVDRRTYD